MYANLNFVRNFGFRGRKTLQARMDVQNLLQLRGLQQSEHRSDEHQLRQGGSAVSAAGAMRFFSFVARFSF